MKIYKHTHISANQYSQEDKTIFPFLKRGDIQDLCFDILNNV